MILDEFFFWHFRPFSSYFDSFWTSFWVIWGTFWITWDKALPFWTCSTFWKMFVLIFIALDKFLSHDIFRVILSYFGQGFCYFGQFFSRLTISNHFWTVLSQFGQFLEMILLFEFWTSFWHFRPFLSYFDSLWTRFWVILNKFDSL